MDRSSFDALTRRIAHQTTRRAALTTLLGGALLLREDGATEATDRAQRRKRRKRRQRNQRDTVGNFWLKGISFWIDNRAGTNTIIAEAGEVTLFGCCQGLAAFTIPPGQMRLFDTSTPAAYVWINNKYWIEFSNPGLYLPRVVVAKDGVPQSVRDSCCKPHGTTIDSMELDVGQHSQFVVDGHYLQIFRNTDKLDFKYFNVGLPPGF